MAKILSELDRLTAVLAKDAPPTMTQAQSDKLRPVMTALLATAAFSGAHQDYRETANPIHLLSAFVTARRAGKPAPEWVSRSMTAAIELFLACPGTMTLDDAFGFMPKQGKRTKWTEQDQRLQDARLKWLIEQQLKIGLPLMSDKAGVPSAVKVVAKQLGYGEKTHESLRRTYQRIKKHSSRLSR